MYERPDFYNADCMKAMKEFPNGFFDIAIVDPPYGINITGRHKKSTSCGGGDTLIAIRGNASAKSARCKPNLYLPFDDTESPTKDYFDELMRISKKQVIWGGNYFLDYLGKATCMIVWDKKRRGMSQSDCEIAWTNLKGQSRIFEYRWNGMLQEDMKHKEKRIHPTQKPIALYEWLLKTFAKSGDKILDTHVGSASSLIACKRLGFEYWGFEISKAYFEIAKKRMEEDSYQLTIGSE